MDFNESSFYLSSLKEASEEMLLFPRSRRFLHWASDYLVAQWKASSASVALYDKKKDLFSFEVSSGRNRIPPRLVALNARSSLVRWFLHVERSSPPKIPRFCQVVTLGSLGAIQDALSDLTSEELRRHRAEVCIKIEMRDRVAGYLLIGSRQDGFPFTDEDVVFFQTLANDIAVAIEKEEYYRFSHFDPLTGILNRRCLDEKFLAILERKKESASQLGVALFDLDDFKKINDRFGHLVGDHVLRITADILRAGIRKSDLLFRYGGEEFLILLGRSPRDPAKARLGKEIFQTEIYQVLDRLRQRIANRPYEYLGHSVPVTASVGVSFYTPESVISHEELIRQADEALYVSKRRGKNLVSIYSSETR